MRTVTSTTSVYNGVSQQSPELRLETQVSEQINCVSSPVYGVRRRNPTEYTGISVNLGDVDRFVHSYTNDYTGEKYMIIIPTSGTPTVFDLNTSTSKDVIVKSDKAVSYLATEYPSLELTGLTVGDTTFLVNKTKEVAIKPFTPETLGSPTGSCTYIWVKRAFAANPYAYYVYAKDNSGTKTTIGLVDGSTQGSRWAKAKHTNNVASKLAADINGIDGYSAEVRGSVIRVITPPDVEIFTSDSYGDQALFAWSGYVKSISELPSKLGFSGDTFCITEAGTGSFGKYYVVYDGESYIETTVPEAAYQLDKETMPVKLIRNSNGDFELDTIDWDGREAGDVVNNPNPSIVGNSVVDIVFYKDRLGLLTNTAICLSEIGNYYNFFATTVSDVLDSDPIDVLVGTDAVSLQFLEKQGDSLLIFGNSRQYSLSGGGDPLTPKTVTIETTTTLNINTLAKPISLGSNVYFLANKGSSSVVYEYFSTSRYSNKESVSITDHIPSYIPKNIKKIVGSPENNILVLLPYGESKTLYIYQFLFEGSQKIQSAWHKWEFSSPIKDLFIMDGWLYLLNKGKTYSDQLCRLRLTPTHSDDTTYLDNGLIDYQSLITLTPWTIKDETGVGQIVGRLQLRKVCVKVDAKSCKTRIVYKNRQGAVLREDIRTHNNNNNTKLITRHVLHGSMLTDISIISDGGSNMDIKLVSFEGNYSNLK